MKYLKYTALFGVLCAVAIPNSIAATTPSDIDRQMQEFDQDFGKVISEFHQQLKKLINQEIPTNIQFQFIAHLTIARLTKLHNKIIRIQKEAKNTNLDSQKSRDIAITVESLNIAIKKLKTDLAKEMLN